ncbi:MAG: hypothetical protein WC895_03125 [Candidatus Shapirobacteria bacterium]|jgi:hypothetical protein
MFTKKKHSIIKKIGILKKYNNIFNFCLKKKQRTKASNYVKKNFGDVIRRLSFE